MGLGGCNIGGYIYIGGGGGFLGFGCFIGRSYGLMLGGILGRENKGVFWLGGFFRVELEF